MISRDEICQEMKAAGLDSGSNGWTMVFLAAVLMGVAVFLIGVWGTQPERAWQVFLVNYLFWSGMAFGSVLFSATLVMTKARWGRPIKRLAEAPVAFLTLGLPALLGPFLGPGKTFPLDPAPVALQGRLAEYRLSLCQGRNCPLYADGRFSGPGLFFGAGRKKNCLPRGRGLEKIPGAREKKICANRPSWRQSWPSSMP